MVVVYLDTNAFDHIVKRWGVDDKGVFDLGEAARNRKLSILLSVEVLQETLALLDREPLEKVAPQMQLILDLCDWARILKPADQLVKENFDSFASTGSATAPLFTGEDQIRFSLLLRKLLLDPSSKNAAERREIINQAKENKRLFRKQMDEFMRETERDIKRWRQSGERPPGFSDLLSEYAERAARHFAQRLGVSEQCAKRGLTELLRIRVVRMATGSALSLQYGIAFEQR